jgi:hypothetical protein
MRGVPVDSVLLPAFPLDGYKPWEDILLLDGGPACNPHIVARLVVNFREALVSSKEGN